MGGGAEVGGCYANSLLAAAWAVHLQEACVSVIYTSTAHKTSMCIYSKCSMYLHARGFWPKARGTHSGVFSCNSSRLNMHLSECLLL